MSGNKLDSFQCGRVIFRFGDMTDADILTKSEVIVVPVASDGRTSGHVTSILRSLGAKTFNLTPGSEVQTEVLERSTNPLTVIYATTIIDKSSSLNQILSVCKKIIVEVNQYKFVSLPMLGTGTGALDPIEVAKIFEETFNQIEINTTFIVHVNNGKTFKSLADYFSEKSRYVNADSLTAKPLIVLRLEELLNCTLSHEEYKVNEGILISLTLKGVSLPFNLSLPPQVKLNSLILFDCQVDNWSAFQTQANIKFLSIVGMKIKDFSFLTNFTKLDSLKLISCNLTEVVFFDLIPNIRILNLSENSISSLEGFQTLKKITQLTVASNKIKNIAPLQGLRKLSFLDIRNNFVEDISPLTNLRIQGLLISNNLISDISPIRTLRRLKNLLAETNPFLQDFEIILEKGQNHKDALLVYLSRLDEDNKVELQLPVKVLLLGNHSSGKSSLLQYLENERLDGNLSSTHIVSINRFGKNKSELPLAMIYDFGGQDYYHGIYRAFLSSGSITLLLWNNSNNFNTVREDSTGVLTQDFNVRYWLSQKKYFEHGKFGNIADPLILVQSYSDCEQKEFFRDSSNSYRIDNEFFVSLKPTNGELNLDEQTDELARKYLKSYVLGMIRKCSVVREEPKWYVNFLKFIDHESKLEEYHSKNVKNDILPHYHREKKEKIVFYLREELDQLHKRGLILYYKDILPNDVWLNPVALAKYIHSSILDKNNSSLKGGRVSVDFFKRIPKKIVKLLELQKVIFYHESGDDGPEYIIPNFLPLFQESNPEFNLFLFGLGTPAYVLKFGRFIPFGLINQMICAFGILPDKKKFWRDQLLFTFEKKAKILIKVNFDQLEICIYTSFINNVSQPEKNDILRYIYYGIMSLYWDMKMLNYQEYLKYFYSDELEFSNISEEESIKFSNAERVYQSEDCRPDDLYLSVDEQHYVRYSQLCVTNAPVISSFLKSSNGTIENETEIIPIYPFELFTRRKLKRAMKVAISYSKQDIAMVDKFRQYLVPLFDDGLIENPWYCTMLEAGQDWNLEIKSRFEAADIVFFMVSENLMSTRYVMDNEIKNAIDRWEKNKNVKIVPIVLHFYHWSRKGKYDLSRFNGFPYSLKPVSDFKDQRMAWHMIEESLRMMIEKNLNPLKGDDNFSKEMQSLHHRIMSGKADADL